MGTRQLYNQNPIPKQLFEVNPGFFWTTSSLQLFELGYLGFMDC